MSQPDPEHLEAQRRVAQRHYLDGKLVQAIQVQLEVVNQQKDATTFPFDDFHRVAVYMFSLQDFRGATEILRHMRKHAPRDFRVLSGLGGTLTRMGQYDEAIGVLEEARSLEPGDANVHDALAHAYGRSGHHAKAVECGEQAIVLKAKIHDAKSPCRFPSRKAPEFDPADPSRNVISFSLWGDKPRYIDGAIANANYARVVYPNWRCRFYCDDTVPESVRDQLRELGAEVQMMNRQNALFDGLFWRFLVIDDPSVSHFLIRDCDAVVNVKERVAVDEWLKSRKWFHLMRDWYSHTDLILAGMWGGVRGVLPPMQELMSEFRSEHLRTRTFDQEFLRDKVWSTVRQNCLIHDRFYRVLGSRPFPPFGDLPPDQHIGQNASALHRRGKLGAQAGRDSGSGVGEQPAGSPPAAARKGPQSASNDADGNHG